MELNQSAEQFKSKMTKKYGTAFTDTLTDYQVACMLAYIAEVYAEAEEETMMDVAGEELEMFYRD